MINDNDLTWKGVCRVDGEVPTSSADVSPNPQKKKKVYYRMDASKTKTP